LRSWVAHVRFVCASLARAARFLVCASHTV